MPCFAYRGPKYDQRRPKAEGQVRAKFEIILDEETAEVFALVLADGSRSSSNRIEASAFGRRRIIEKVPHVEEAIAGHAATGTLLQVKKACDFTTKLKGVASVNLGGNIFEGISPLVENASDVRSKRIHRNAAGGINAIRRKSNGRLRVGADFIPAPAGGIGAGFVEEGGREGVIPDGRESLIDL